MKKIFLPCLLVLCCFTQNAQSFIGCIATGNNVPGSLYQLYAGTGDPSLDASLSTEASLLRNFFSVNAAFFIYDDRSLPGAQAFPLPEILVYPDGTVLLGRHFMLQMNQFAGNITATRVTIAHEFAHLLDSKYKASDGPGMNAELMADFLAGTYLFFRSTLQITEIKKNLEWYYFSGDIRAIEAPEDYGKPQQRLDATLAGYWWLRNHTQTTSIISAADATEAARVYLEKMR